MDDFRVSYEPTQIRFPSDAEREADSVTEAIGVRVTDLPDDPDDLSWDIDEDFPDQPTFERDLRVATWAWLAGAVVLTVIAVALLVN